MTWGYIGGAAVSVIGSSLLSDGGGGGGGSAATSTATKEPWAAAAPWLLQNLQQGQNLQQQYTNQPFSNQQLAAYGNSAAQSDYMHQLVPSLLGQLGQQQVGFDRNNPTAKPKAFDWGGLMASSGAPQIGFSSVKNPAAQAMPAPQQPSGGAGQFTMGSENFLDPTQAGARWTPEQAAQINTALGQTGGGYGSYRVGMQPQMGTQAWADMQLYNQIMGLNKPQAQQFGYGGLLGGNNSGNSIGGSPAADGSGGGGPGVSSAW